MLLVMQIAIMLHFSQPPATAAPPPVATNPWICVGGRCST